MNNNNNKRGFSGLSDLASDIKGLDDIRSTEPSSPPHKFSKPTPKTTTINEKESKASDSIPILDPIFNPDLLFRLFRNLRWKGWKWISGGSSGDKWIIGIIAVVFVILFVNNGGQSERKPSYNPPSSPQSYSYPQSRPAPTVTTSHNSLAPQKIIEAQNLLKELGYDPGQIDGKYDKQTERAMKAFQKDRGLSLDGQLDRNLLNTLKKIKAANDLRTSHSYLSNQKTLAQEIKNGKAQAKQMEIQLKDMDHRLKDYERKMRSYRASGMVDEYNSLVPIFNSLVNERKNLYEEYTILITEVNAKVNRFNFTYR